MKYILTYFTSTGFYKYWKKTNCILYLTDIKYNSFFFQYLEKSTDKSTDKFQKNYKKLNIGMFFSKCYKRLFFYPRIFPYHIYQPLRSGRIWHKVNFLSEV